MHSSPGESSASGGLALQDRSEGNPVLMQLVLVSFHTSFSGVAFWWAYLWCILMPFYLSQEIAWRGQGATPWERSSSDDSVRLRGHWSSTFSFSVGFSVDVFNLPFQGSRLQSSQNAFSRPVFAFRVPIWKRWRKGEAGAWLLLPGTALLWTSVLMCSRTFQRRVPPTGGKPLA